MRAEEQAEERHGESNGENEIYRDNLKKPLNRRLIEFLIWVPYLTLDHHVPEDRQ